MTGWFQRFATLAAEASGKAGAFCAAAGVIVIWALTGPIFGWSDTWQLIINTGTTIVTFLMVFLLQYAQNTDTQALHTKLDELIRCGRADDRVIDIEHADPQTIQATKDRIKESANPQNVRNIPPDEVTQR